MKKFKFMKYLFFIIGIIFALMFLIMLPYNEETTEYVITTIIFLMPSFLFFWFGIWASKKEKTYKPNIEATNINHLKKSTKKSSDNHTNLNSSSNPFFSIETKRSTETTASGPPSDPEDLKLLNELAKTQLLHWCDGKSYPVDYPSYFSYDYFINDADSIHKNWIDAGILGPPTLENLLKHKKVVELKDILRGKNLKVSGNKLDLIKRILDSKVYSLDDFIEDDNIYTLTDSGETVIKDNKPWLYYHTIKNKSIIPLKLYKQQWENLQESWGFVPDGRDISWRCLQLLKMQVKNYGELSLVLSAMIDNLVDSKREELIPDFALQVISIDLSGAYPFLAPYLIERVKQIPKDQLQERFYKAYDFVKVYEHGNINGHLADKDKIFQYILLGLKDIDACNKKLEKINSL